MTTNAVIGFTWQDAPNNGGTATIDYRITYDQAIGNWVELASGIIATSYTTQVTLTAG